MVLVPCEAFQPLGPMRCISILLFVCFYVTFYFGIILDFHKSCKDIAETSCMSFPLLSLILPSHVTMVHLSELRNKHWYSTINYRLYLGFSSFSMNVLFLFQDSIQVILRTIILVSNIPLWRYSNSCNPFFLALINQDIHGAVILNIKQI